MIRSSTSTPTLSISGSTSTTLSGRHQRAPSDRVPSRALMRTGALGRFGAGMSAGMFSRDQTIQCIGAAFEIRNVLRTVGELLAQPELGALSDGLGEAALECQDKFARLLEAARDEALGLVGRLEEFAHGMGRLVRDVEEPVLNGPIEARGSVVTVYATATQASFIDVGTEDQMEALNTALETLEKRAVACTAELEAYGKGPLEDVSEKIDALERHIILALTTRGSLITRFLNNFFTTPPPTLEIMEPLVVDYQVFPVDWKLTPFIKEQIEVCADFQTYFRTHSAAAAWELEQKKRELICWKREVDAKRAEVKKALLCLSAVSRHFALLDDKLGEFEDGLAVLVDDVQGLSDRLEGRSSSVRTRLTLLRLKVIGKTPFRNRILDIASGCERVGGYGAWVDESRT